MPNETRKFDYKWVILVVCFMMVFVCLGFCSSTKGLYHGPVSKELEIDRVLLSLGDTTRFISTAIINLFFGSLLYKYGVRKMAAFGFIMLIASSLVYTFAAEMSTALVSAFSFLPEKKYVSTVIFCIGGVFLGVGLAFTTTTMASTMVRRWFNKDIGKYTGIVFAANGVGGALAVWALDPIITNENGYNFFNRHFMGYQASYLLTALLLLVFGTIVVVLLKDPANGNAPRLPAKAKKKARGSTWAGIDYLTAKRSPYFYITVVVVFLTGFSLQGINTIYKAHMTDIGMDAGVMRLIVSAFSMTLTFTKILVGALYDRFNLRKVMIICQSSAVVAFIALASLVLFVGNITGNILAIAFALLFALALPLETLVIPLIANDLFGSKSYDKILGLLLAANYTGYALGSPFIDIFHDVGGHYEPGLLLLSGVMLLALILMQFGINKANKVKQQVIAATAAEEV